MRCCAIQPLCTPNKEALADEVDNIVTSNSVPDPIPILATSTLARSLNVTRLGSSAACRCAISRIESSLTLLSPLWLRTGHAVALPSSAYLLLLFPVVVLWCRIV